MHIQIRSGTNITVLQMHIQIRPGANITVHVFSVTIIHCVSFVNPDSTIFRVRTVMKNLEKSWNFKTAFSRPGKVLEK